MIGNYTEGDEPVPGFRLLRHLGWGKFGEVWKAAAPGGTEVALKIVNLADTLAVKEFGAVRRVCGIRHPHLVPIHSFWLKGRDGAFIDSGLVDDGDDAVLSTAELVLAMGLGDGSLGDRLATCQSQGCDGVPPDELLGYLDDIARAIDHLNSPVHDLGDGPVGIQHCDIKPSNVLLVGGVAQVCDLGVARLLGEVRGVAVGTAAYMAPEFIQEGRPSSTTDQYALALTYTELRTGQLPIKARSPALAYLAHLRGQLELDRLPEAERAVVRQATSLRPEDRFPNCLALSEALRKACAYGPRATPRTLPELLLTPPCRLPDTVIERRPPPSVAPPSAAPPPAPTWSGTTDADLEDELCSTNLDLPEFPGPPGSTDTGFPVPETTSTGPVIPQRRRLALLPSVAAAMLLGATGAWLTGSALRARPGTVAIPQPAPVVTATMAVDPPKPPPSPPAPTPRSVAPAVSLAAAILAARDGETLLVQGNGPHALPPLDLRGRSLTLRAAPGSSPVLLLAEPSWSALFTADRPLTLEGLELRREHEGPAHLIESLGSVLVLRDCRLVLPRGSAAVIVRQPERVEVDHCVWNVRDLALCFQGGDGRAADLMIRDSTFQVASPTGAVLSFWAAEPRRGATWTLHLERNRVAAGRLLAFTGWPGRLEVGAKANEIAFRSALCSFAAYPTDGWRSVAQWQEEENRFKAGLEWLEVDGMPGRVESEEAWRQVAR